MPVLLVASVTARSRVVSGRRTPPERDRRRRRRTTHRHRVVGAVAACTPELDRSRLLRGGLVGLTAGHCGSVGEPCDLEIRGGFGVIGVVRSSALTAAPSRSRTDDAVITFATAKEPTHRRAWPGHDRRCRTGTWPSARRSASRGEPPVSVAARAPAPWRRPRSSWRPARNPATPVARSSRVDASSDCCAVASSTPAPPDPEFPRARRLPMPGRSAAASSMSAIVADLGAQVGLVPGTDWSEHPAASRIVSSPSRSPGSPTIAGQLSARCFFSCSTSKSGSGHSRSNASSASINNSVIDRRANHLRSAGKRHDEEHRRCRCGRGRPGRPPDMPTRTPAVDVGLGNGLPATVRPVQPFGQSLALLVRRDVQHRLDDGRSLGRAADASNSLTTLTASATPARAPGREHAPPGRPATRAVEDPDLTGVGNFARIRHRKSWRAVLGGFA